MSKLAIRTHTLRALSTFLLIGLIAAPATAEELGDHHFGWFGVGTTHQVGENHAFWVGEFSGTVFAANGSGPLHGASVACPGSNHIRDGMAKAQGICTLTDAEGDKNVIEWSCEGQLPKCEGTYRYISGTGKFAGISGENKFTGIFGVPSTSGDGLSGYAVSAGAKIPR